MKQISILVAIAALMISVMSLATPQINKIHTGMSKDGVKINCTYCHKTNKLPKVKTKDMKALQKNKGCTGKGCHSK